MTKIPTAEGQLTMEQILFVIRKIGAEASRQDNARAPERNLKFCAINLISFQRSPSGGLRPVQAER
jgi:hypothetical protein